MIADPERGVPAKLKILEIDPAAIDLWATMSDGDARRALMALEVAVLSLQAERDADKETGRRGRFRGSEKGFSLPEDTPACISCIFFL